MVRTAGRGEVARRNGMRRLQVVLPWTECSGPGHVWRYSANGMHCVRKGCGCKLRVNKPRRRA